jgi:hypothetical protein
MSAPGSSLSPVLSGVSTGAHLRDIHGTRVSAHQLPRALVHDNCAIRGDLSDSREQERRPGLEYSSRKMIVS